jgi:hypothetical protein
MLISLDYFSRSSWPDSTMPLLTNPTTSHSAPESGAILHPALDATLGAQPALANEPASSGRAPSLCGPLSPLFSGVIYAGEWAGKAATTALIPLAPLAPIGRRAGALGSQAASAAFFAGAASKAHAQIVMGRAMLGAGRIAALGRESAMSLVRGSGVKTTPGSMADKAASAAGVGASIAIETYPLWMALIRMAASHSVTFSPADLASLNHSPLPFEQAMILSAQGSIDEAHSALGKLVARRRRDAKSSALANPAEALSDCAASDSSARAASSSGHGTTTLGQDVLHTKQSSGLRGPGRGRLGH